MTSATINALWVGVYWQITTYLSIFSVVFEKEGAEDAIRQFFVRSCSVHIATRIMKFRLLLVAANFFGVLSVTFYDFNLRRLLTVRFRCKFTAYRAVNILSNM